MGDPLDFIQNQSGDPWDFIENKRVNPWDFLKNQRGDPWEFLEKHLAEKGAEINAVVLLDLDLYTAFKRAFGRVSDPDSGASYNYYFKTDGVDFKWVSYPDNIFPPRLDAFLEGTNTLLKRRPDDASADAVLRRIDTFVKETQSLVDYFSDKGIVKTIDANQSISAVTADIKTAIDEVK